MYEIQRHQRRYFIGFFVTVIALLGALYMASCVGAPKSVKQLTEMADDDFNAWTGRVALWVEFGTWQAVKKEPRMVEELTTFADLVEAATGDDPIGTAAQSAGLDEPLVMLILLEGRALIQARGGLPGGPRERQVLGAIASGVRAGIVNAQPAPSMEDK